MTDFDKVINLVGTKKNHELVLCCIACAAPGATHLLPHLLLLLVVIVVYGADLVFFTFVIESDEEHGHGMRSNASLLVEFLLLNGAAQKQRQKRVLFWARVAISSNNSLYRRLAAPIYGGRRSVLDKTIAHRPAAIMILLFY